uniref:DUF4388 domain-containing protein n=1 Tax=Heterorhabditis bacteriophora TaxID=37862 RepID=A0A1I7WM57_HETBA
MRRASILILHERGQIKALPTAGYTVKRIADVFKRSRKLNDREKGEILRTASNNTISITEIRGTCGIDATESTAVTLSDEKKVNQMALIIITANGRVYVSDTGIFQSELSVKAVAMEPINLAFVL